MTNTAITWKEYKAFMTRFHESHFQTRSDSARFFREQAKATNRAVSTLRNLANGNSRPEWRKRFYAEHKIKIKKARLVVEPIKPPSRKVMDGVIINHKIKLRSWV